MEKASRSNSLLNAAIVFFCFTFSWWNAFAAPGELFAVGYRLNGVIGDGRPLWDAGPVHVAHGVVKVECSDRSTFFLDNRGELQVVGSWYAAHPYIVLRENNDRFLMSPHLLSSDVKTFAVTSIGGSHAVILIKNDQSLWFAPTDRIITGISTGLSGKQFKLLENGVKEIGISSSHAYYIKNDGSLWSFDLSASMPHFSPKQVFHDVEKVAVGGGFAAFVTRDSSLYTIGRNPGGVGFPLWENSDTAVRIDTNVDQVNASEVHFVYRKTDGSVWTIGENDCGQIGNGTIQNQAVPVRVEENARFVKAGAQATFVIKNDGTLWVSGAKRWESDPKDHIRYMTSLVEGGSMTSNNYSTSRFQKLGSSVVDVASSGLHRVWVEVGGGMFAQGTGIGSLGDGVDYFYATQPVSIYQQARQVSAGRTNSFWVDGTDALWGCGWGGNGILGLGSTTSRNQPSLIDRNVSSASVGGYHSLYIRSDGTLWGMGWNGQGALGNGKTDTAIRPVRIATGIKSASAGGYHSLILRYDGSLLSMGYNSNGQLGIGNTDSKKVPVTVMKGVKSVSSGEYHSLFIKDDNTLWGMGSNAYGQLGNGTTQDSLTPIMISENVQHVSAGSNYSLFVKMDGTLWGMGRNSSGQLGSTDYADKRNPVKISDRVVHCSAGNYHSVFIKEDSSLWGMGYTKYYQNNRLDYFNKPVLIRHGVSFAEAGGAHTLFVSNGRIPLYQFTHKTNDSFFFTATEGEKDAVVGDDERGTLKYDGISHFVMDTQVPSTLPVYRLFNRVIGSHFYTMSESEARSLVSRENSSFVIEGIAFFAYAGEIDGAKPVYRFYAPRTMSHFFTVSEVERDRIIETIPTTRLRYEGVAWYGFPSL